MPIAYTSTRVRRNPVPRETRVPTAMPAPERIRLDRGAARAPAALGGRGPPGRPPGLPAARGGTPGGGPLGMGGDAPGGGAPGGGRYPGGGYPGCGYRGRWSSGGGRYSVGRGTRRQPGGASAGPPGPPGPGGAAGVNRGTRGGRAGGAGHSSASGSVVSAGLGPPPGMGPSSGGRGSASAACRPGRDRSSSSEPGSGSGVVGPASCLGQVIRSLRRGSCATGTCHDGTCWVAFLGGDPAACVQPPPDGAEPGGEHEHADGGADEEQDGATVPGRQDRKS